MRSGSGAPIGDARAEESAAERNNRKEPSAHDRQEVRREMQRRHALILAGNLLIHHSCPPSSISDGVGSVRHWKRYILIPGWSPFRNMGATDAGYNKTPENQIRPSLRFPPAPDSATGTFSGVPNRGHAGLMASYVWQSSLRSHAVGLEPTMRRNSRSLLSG